MKNITLLLLFFFLMGTGMTAGAQGIAEPSKGEDVAIAFFKTANTRPDFALWAKGAPKYKTVAPARADMFLEDEQQRLIKRWQEYNPDNDFIDIRADVAIELKITVDENGNESYWMYMSFKTDGITYFPYTFMDYKFAVIPQKIETLMIQKLEEQQFRLIFEEFKNKMTGGAYLYLQLKPVKAYINQPYMIDGAEQWALLCDVAGLALKSYYKKTPLWHYSADWYISPVNKELQGLYNAPATGVTTAPSLP